MNVVTKLPNDLMTTTEVCRLLRISKATLRRWTQRGEIPVIKIGPALRYSRSELARTATREVTP